jgi:Protein of unknown function (DUF1194)
MLARTTISALAAGAAALALTGWTGGIGSPHASRSADNRPGTIAVDAELVIAVDVSNSMDPEEQALQREGYIMGLTSREHKLTRRGFIARDTPPTNEDFALLSPAYAGLSRSRRGAFFCVSPPPAASTIARIAPRTSDRCPPASGRPLVMPFRLVTPAACRSAMMGATAARSLGGSHQR